MAKPVRCRLGWHLWRRMTNDDNEAYRGCARCGAIDDDYYAPGSGMSVG